MVDFGETRECPTYVREEGDQMADGEIIMSNLRPDFVFQYVGEF